MQKITIIGNLTHSPELRNLESGMICSFTVAVNSVVRQEKIATYYRVNAWGKLADICDRYLSKGSKVAVIGDLSARLYDGRDGEKRMSLDVRATDVEFLSAKSADSSEADEEMDQDMEDCPV